MKKLLVGFLLIVVAALFITFAYHSERSYGEEGAVILDNGSGLVLGFLLIGDDGAIEHLSYKDPGYEEEFCKWNSYGYKAGHAYNTVLLNLGEEWNSSEELKVFFERMTTLSNQKGCN